MPSGGRSSVLVGDFLLSKGLWWPVQNRSTSCWGEESNAVREMSDGGVAAARALTGKWIITERLTTI